MYKDTAQFYDRLTSDVDVSKYAAYFTEVFKKHAKIHPKSVMDLGCGTGRLTFAMAEKGYDMTGVDGSTEMLSVAYGKKGPGILWINQDFTELDLFGTYNAAVSLLDCVNHLLTDEMVAKFFKRLRYFIEPGGLFIFDINSEYKFNSIYKDNVFYSVDDDFSYIWQNHFDKNTGICTMDMTFFRKEGDVYKRFESVNKEKYYSIDFLREALKKSGFSVEALYNDCSFDEPTKTSKRIFFVCRRMD
ncbi:MAG: class I SAM-dependent methyltransferase [Clostridiales bacterium]|nr:class I SAM-dependent methyltransferase [Clostridiales bacterium]